MADQRDADAGADGDDPSADVEGLTEEADEPFAHFGGPVAGVRLVDDDGKFVAAEFDQVDLPVSV